jgi:hypothetical protein
LFTLSGVNDTEKTTANPACITCVVANAHGGVYVDQDHA